MAFSDRLNTSRWLAPALLGGYCAFLFFYGLNVGDLYRNETLRAIIAREMLHSGNWIVPTLYGEPIFTKPPGMYWAIALCSWPFGEVTEWTARLPSALAASACVFLIYWLFSLLLDRRAGLVAGLLLPMSAFWLERATSAEIDMVQVSWVTAAIVLFLRAVINVDGTLRVPGVENGMLPVPGLKTSTRSVLPTLALVCVASGTLTKWTAPVFFYGTVIPFLWWRGRLSLLFGWRHVLAVATAVVLVATWIGAVVAQSGWDNFYATVSREAFNHIASGHRKAYLSEALLHPFKVLGAMLPWSAVALAALWPSFYRGWDAKGRFLLHALHCWAWPSLLFWTLTTDHSLRHSAPLFPAMAGMAALVWVSWTRDIIAWKLPKLKPSLVLAGALTAWMIVKVLFIEIAIPMRDDHRQTRTKAALVASLVPASAVLYLMKLKDEGIMFYFGRPVVRAAGSHALPSASGPLFCILTEDEWQHWSGRSAWAALYLQDAQGDNIVLVRLD